MIGMEDVAGDAPSGRRPAAISKNFLRRSFLASPSGEEVRFATLTLQIFDIDELRYSTALVYTMARLFSPDQESGHLRFL